MPCSHVLARALGNLGVGAHLGFADRRPFAGPGAKPQYNPDRPCQVEHIRVEVALDFPKKTVRGTCTLTLKAVSDGIKTVPLDAVDLVISSVKVAGRRVRWEPSEGGITVFLPRPLKAGRRLSIAVAYHVVEPRFGMYFIGPDKDYPSKPVQAWSQGQDNDSQHWFPCHDSPNTKSTTEMIATVPEDMFALSNGRLLKTTRDRRRRTKTFHWLESVPHATYLVTLAAGSFTEIRARAGKVPVTYYVQPGREADARRAFGNTPAMIRFFERRLGVSYAYEKYAQVAVADFIFGGMENTSATTQTDLTLHDARAHLDFSSDFLVAHELAHQWFGDLVTCKDWSHGWLNEGFATYLEACWTEHHLGQDEFRYELLQNARNYLGEDARYRRPIVTNVYTEPIDLFDRHLYEKGGWVLHMLRGELGEEAFWASIRRYLLDNARGSVETVDLQRAVEKVTGRNLQPFFDQWIFKGGHPDLKAAYAWNAETRTASLTVSQVQDPADGTSLFRFPLQILFGDGRRGETRSVEVSRKEQTFTFKLARRPRWVRLDPENRILKTLDFPRGADLLTAQLRSDPDALGRAEAARDLAKLGTPEAFRALRQVLRKDRFWGVQAETAKALGANKSSHAFRLLKTAVSVRHPKARRAVTEALGEFRTSEAAKTLLPLLAKDASYFVEASAARALGRTRDASALEALEKALSRSSHLDVLRSGCLAGLSELEEERAFDLVKAWTSRGRPEHARLSALGALAALAEGRPRWAREALDILADRLAEGGFRLQRTALAAFAALKDDRCAGPIQRLIASSPDPRVLAQAQEVLRAFREKGQAPEAVRKLREDLESLSAEHRKLTEKVSRMQGLEKAKG